MSKYLFISSHCDDFELSAGGYVSREIENGHEVTILCLSKIYNGVCLHNEFINSMKMLRPDQFGIFDFKVRDFQIYRQQILQLFYDHSKLGYDYVITHSAKDFHIDHKVVGEESIRAFKHCNLITYVGEWNQRSQTKNYFVELEPRHIENKLKALSCYQSQSERPYMSPEFIKANAINNGIIAGTKYAEAFEVINYLV